MIGVHYPKPMVNHAEASRLNIERMKQIYQQLSCYRGLGEDAAKSSMEQQTTSALGKLSLMGFLCPQGFWRRSPPTPTATGATTTRRVSRRRPHTIPALLPVSSGGPHSRHAPLPAERCLIRKHLVLQVIRCPFRRRETGKAAP